MTDKKVMTFRTRAAAARYAKEVGGSVYRAGDKWGVLLPKNEWDLY